MHECDGLDLILHCHNICICGYRSVAISKVVKDHQSNGAGMNNCEQRERDGDGTQVTMVNGNMMTIISYTIVSQTKVSAPSYPKVLFYSSINSFIKLRHHWKRLNCDMDGAVLDDGGAIIIMFLFMFLHLTESSSILHRPMQQHWT